MGRGVVSSSSLTTALVIVLAACGDVTAPNLEGSTSTSSESASGPEAGSEAGSEASSEASGEASSEAGESATETSSTLCDADPTALAPQPEGPFIAQGTSVSDTRELCASTWHAAAGSAASTLRVTLESNSAGTTHPLQLRLEDLLGNPLVDWQARAEGEYLEVTLPQSGEFFVRVAPVDAEAPAHDYTLSLSCQSGCNLEYTRYPTLFMHGMAGTEAFVDLVDYWFQVEDYVRTPGFEVIIRAVDAFAGTPERAVQWAAHIEALVDAGVGRRFNLLAHSQGGLDARYYASLLDTQGRVASITTVATPHLGTSAADLALGTFDAFFVDPVTVNSVVEVLAGFIGLSGPDLVGQLESLSTDQMAVFNDEVLNVPGVYYSSWSGKSCRATDLLCQSQNNGEVVDPFFAPTHSFMRLAEGDNDGAVGVESAKWGDWQGEISADHMDEIGQILDVNNPSFDHQEFYLSELRRLAARGL